MAEHANHSFSGRLAHWLNLICMIGLIITGIYIHRPWTSENTMFLARYWHFFFMYLISFNLIYRIIYAFVSGDYKNFGFKSGDLGKLVRVASYYAFIGDHEPSGGKYNPLQRLSYVAIVLLIFVQAITGVALYRPEYFPGLVDFLGGLHTIRITHYLLMWVFIAFTTIHAYMVYFEAPEQFGAMFLGKKIKE